MSKSQRTIKVNDMGEFDLNLPIGIYKVTINAQAFCTFRRKEVIVKANDIILLNTSLFIRSAPPQCENYDAFHLVDPSGINDYIGINYAEQITRGDYIEYKSGFLRTSGDIQVSVSYRGINFIAEKVILNLRTFHLEAINNVVLIDRGKRRKLNHLNLYWKKKIASRQPDIRE